jgi:hypothetical protein
MGSNSNHKSENVGGGGPLQTSPQKMTMLPNNNPQQMNMNHGTATGKLDTSLTPSGKTRIDNKKYISF